jgi:hypothetical protein
MNKDQIVELYMQVGKLKNAFPHGCPEWKEFTKLKKAIRKQLWEALKLTKS